MAKIKALQSTLERNFTVEYKGKTYHVSYLNSDGQVLSLLNRDNWEVLDEYFEELPVCQLKDDAKKEKQNIKTNINLSKKLISFCINHFNDYNPKLNP